LAWKENHFLSGHFASMLFLFETGKGQICTELLSHAALGQIQNVFAFLIGQLLCSFEIDL